MSRFNKSHLLASAAQVPMLSVVPASAIVLTMFEILLYDKSELWASRTVAIRFALCFVTALSLAILKSERHV